MAKRMKRGTDGKAVRIRRCRNSALTLAGSEYRMRDTSPIKTWVIAVVTKLTGIKRMR